jgi:transposase
MTQKNVREYQRAQCFGLRKTDMSYHAIGTNVGISRASVQRAFARFEETGGFQDRRRCGRPEKLNGRNVRMLKHLAQNDDNRSSAREIMIK